MLVKEAPTLIIWQALRNLKGFAMMYIFSCGRISIRRDCIPLIYIAPIFQDSFIDTDAIEIVWLLCILHHFVGPSYPVFRPYACYESPGKPPLSLFLGREWNINIVQH